MKKVKQKLKTSTHGVFQEWNDMASIQAGDPALTILKKTGIRIGGIILMTLFSPLIILAFIFVLIAAA